MRPIANKTSFLLQEEKLTLRVSEEFIHDGRLPLVNDENQADGVVVGEITRYIKEDVSYDAAHVVHENKMWILLNLKCIDLVNKVVLWEEPRMEQSFRYLAPIQAGDAVTFETRVSDVFDKKGGVSMAAAHLHETPVAPPGVPADLAEVVLKCLAKDPADRYQSVKELEQALAACACSADWDHDQAEAWWKANGDGR